MAGKVNNNNSNNTNKSFQTKQNKQAHPERSLIRACIPLKKKKKKKSICCSCRCFRSISMLCKSASFGSELLFRRKMRWIRLREGKCVGLDRERERERGGGGGGVRGERERERERERQTDRQTDRQTESKTNTRTVGVWQYPATC